MSKQLLKHIRVIPDFPKAGINFYDIQSLLSKPKVWKDVVESLTEKVRNSNVDMIIGIESRGFITAVPVAFNLGLPFGMVRKPGKLPGDVVSQEYALEYGSDKIEIQRDLIKSGMRVAIVDDLLATGGTMKAAGDLIKKMSGEVVLAACILELPELCGVEKLDFPFESIVKAPLDPAKGLAA